MNLQPANTRDYAKQISNLEENMKITVVTQGSMGLSHDFKTTLLGIQNESYAQYPETWNLIHKPPRKRKMFQFRIIPNENWLIFKGHIDINEDHYIKEKKGNCTLSYTSFSDEPFENIINDKELMKNIIVNGFQSKWDWRNELKKVRVCFYNKEDCLQIKHYDSKEDALEFHNLDTFCGPMRDDDHLRYETPAVYKVMSA